MIGKTKKILFKRIPGKWKQFFNVLSKKEKWIFVSLFVLFLSSAIFLQLNYYYRNTVVIPAFGGEYKEGLIGQPRFINPLYFSDNDCDRDLVEVLFSGLLKYDSQGNIVKDLVDSYSIKDNGLSYEFTLKDNILWHDGQPLTVADVAFTVELVQYPQYKSPLRIEWLGVRTQTEGTKKIIFHLQKKYSSFLETVARLKILPKHIFQDITPENLPWVLTEKQYLQGSGPFKVKTIEKEKSGYIKKIILERNKEFYGNKPFIGKLSFYFYQNVSELVRDGRTGKIDGFSVSSPKYIKTLEKEGLHFYRLSLPRYFALFFNLNNLKNLDNNVRKAISFALSKEEILNNVFLGEGRIVDSPVLYKYYGINPPSSVPGYDVDKAKQILESAGYKENPKTGIMEKAVAKSVPALFKSELKVGSKGKEVEELQKCLAKDKSVYPQGDITGYFGSKTKAAVIRFQEKYSSEILKPIGLKKGTGKVGGMTRDKLNRVCQDVPKKIVSLEFELTTSDKFPLKEIAENIKEQLKRIGIKVNIKTVSFSELQTNVLAKRSFQTLLFGEALGSLPDPFPFWHSSQKDYPGLNITGYNSKVADAVLEKIREVTKEEDKKEYLEKLQDIIIKDLPAIFFVKGDYFYFLSPKIKGYKVEKITEPSKRLSGIETWYIKAKRKWVK